MSNVINTVVRCHVKNEHRLALLHRTISSLKEKGVGNLGTIFILDDSSPMGDEVGRLALNLHVEYVKATGVPGTKNGFAKSLLLSENKPVLCCVDDMVAGRGISENILAILGKEIPSLENHNVNWAGVGMFACYEHRPAYPNTLLWNIPIDSLYALVCHIFSTKLQKLVIDEWTLVESGKLKEPIWQDDLWVKQICKNNHMLMFNCLSDFAQHTGMQNRSFGNNPIEASAGYISKLFVGE